MDRLIAIFVLFVSSCIPIPPGQGKYCGYPGLKRHSDICKEGLTCFSDDVCRRPLAHGDVCTDQGECAPGLYCQCPDDECNPEKGVCVAAFERGDRCQHWYECGPGLGCSDGVCAPY
jgi:hypothetical protein